MYFLLLILLFICNSILLYFLNYFSLVIIISELTNHMSRILFSLSSLLFTGFKIRNWKCLYIGVF